MESQRRAPHAGDNRTVRLDGVAVKAARSALGCSRERLVETSQGSVHAVSVATIKRAENGEPIYINSASSLAVLLRTPLHELLLRAASEPVCAPPQAMIAVMPLHAVGAHIGAFADGLVEDMITRLSRWWFPVIARTTTLAAAGPDPQSAARALGAKYWIDGGVRRDRHTLRITAQIADTDTGAVVARHTYDRPFADVFALQNELTAAIVADLGPPLLDVEARRFEHRDPKDLDAWQQALRGAWHFYRRTAADNQRARALLAGALQADKHMPLAWYALALTHQQDLINQWSQSPAQSIDQLQQVSSEFERLYPDDAWSQVACAYLDVYKGRRDTAMGRLATAIEIDPNTCLAYSLYGQTLAMAGEPDRGLEQFEVALRLNPKDTERWSTYTGMALAHFVAARYEETVAAAMDAVRVRPSAAFPHAVLASAQAHLGKTLEAQQALRTMLELQPNMSSSGIVSVMGSTEKDIGARYLEGLRRAGLPS